MEKSCLSRTYYLEKLILLLDDFNEKNESENERPDNVPNGQKSSTMETKIKKLTFRSDSKVQEYRNTENNFIAT